MPPNSLVGGFTIYIVSNHFRLYDREYWNGILKVFGVNFSAAPISSSKIIFPGAGAREVFCLDDCQLLFSGGRRLVYQHPERDNLLIKVIRPDRLQENGEFQSTNKLSIKLNRTFGPYISFAREIREMTRAARAAHFSSLEYPFPYLYGFIYTNLGLGIVIEKITDSSGAAAPTVLKLMNEGKFTQLHHARIHEFFDICEKHHYILSDISSANLVFQDQNGGNFICVDGSGEKALMPVHEWFCWANKWKLRRARARVEAGIRRYLVLHAGKSAPVADAA